jgi:cysteine desulfurase
MNYVYFDHAATTGVDPRVFARMEPYFSEFYGNASEIHGPGRKAREAVDWGRAAVAQALGANEKEIVFTSGGTEADNMALIGYAQRFSGGHIITSAVEHPAVMESARFLQRQGWDVTFVPVDQYGAVDVDAYRAAFRDDTRLASVMLANNVVGTLQPVAELARIAHDQGVAFHTDAVQVAGSLPIDVDELGVDMLSISGHKIYAPKGIGALYVRKGTRIGPILHGGGHERRLRSGTENVPGIVGIGAALELAVAEMSATRPRLEQLRDKVVAATLATIDEVQLLGDPLNRLPGNACFSIRYIEGESMLLQLDGKGIAVSSGSACASGSLEPSHVILAMGFGAEEAHGSLRLTLGRENTEAEIDYFLEVFPPIVEHLRKMSPLYVKG